MRKRILVFCLGMPLVLAMLACLGSATLTPSATAIPATAIATSVPAALTPTVASAPVGDARSAVLQALQAVFTAGPYRVIATTVSGATTIQMHGEVILPDRFHLISSIGGSTEREYLIIGSTTYTKVGDQWTEVPIDVTSLVGGFLSSLDPDSISDVSLVGTEDVNGTTAQVYTFVYTNTINGTQIVTNDKLWIANGLPIKQTVDSDSTGTTYHSEQTIEYDSTITIEAPATP